MPSKVPPPNTSNVLAGLSGYPGQLTQAETASLEKFRTLITEAKIYTPASSTSRASHTETTLCRFLRARRFDADKAFKQFSENEAWRKQNNVDELYRTFPVEELEEAKQFYPTWTGRRDRRGLPVYVYRLSTMDSKRQKKLNAVSEERRLQRIIALYEYMSKGVFGICAGLAPTSRSPSLSTSNSNGLIPRTRDELCTSTNIIDLGGVSLMQLWNLKSHLQQSSTLGTAYYPETLDSILVVNSPSFFPTAWGWVQGWFDPGTRNKIRVLGNPEKDAKTREVLTSFISEEDLPKAYGGSLEWAVGDAPAMDDRTRGWVREAMGLEGEVPLRGPVFADPWALEATSKGMAKVDSGVGLEAAAGVSEKTSAVNEVKQEPLPAATLSQSQPQAIAA